MLKKFEFSWSRLIVRPSSLIFLTLVTVLALVTVLLMPPVWKLHKGSIQIQKWPRSGPQLVSIGPGEPDWVPLEKVSKHVINAIVVAEDARFYEHFGLDFREIRTSIAFNMEKGRYARGASTITQQVVKIAFLDNDKNILRKFREALGAITLELILTKDEILAWYINIVEFGDGIYGIKGAANTFFQTDPELLTIQNGAHLAMVLPSPNKWGRALKEKELTSYGHRRFASIIEEMYKLGFITSTLRQSALATGDFGRPIYGYESSNNEEQDFDEPYYALPGSEPPPFGHDPPKPKKQKLNKNHQKPTSRYKL